MLVIASLMSLEEFGRFAVYWSTILVLGAFASIGAPQFLLRELAAYQAAPGRGVSLSYATKLAVIIPGIVLASAYGIYSALRLFGIALPLLPGDVAAFSIVIASMVSVQVQHVAIIFRVFECKNSAMYISLAGNQFILLASLVLMTACAEPSADLLLNMFALSGAVVVILIWICHWAFFPVGTLFRETEESKLSLSFWVNGTLSILIKHTDTFIGGAFLVAEHLGVYQVVKRISNLAILPKTVSDWDLTTEIAQSAAVADAARLEAHARRYLHISVWPSLVFAGAVLSLSPVIMRFYEVGFSWYWVALFVLMLANPIIRVLYGGHMTFATQLQLEHFSAIARFGAFFVVVGAYLLLPVNKTPISIAAAFLLMTTLSSTVIWLAVRARAGVDTSIGLYFRPGPGQKPKVRRR